MEDYNKIIESLGVKFIKTSKTKVLHPVSIENYYDVENTIILLNRASIKFGDNDEVAEAGQVLFLPGGKMTSITYGTGPSVKMSNDDFLSNKKKYFQPVSADDIENPEVEYFTSVGFEAKVFNSVNFFSSLDLPPFVARDNAKLKTLIEKIISEKSTNKPGKDRIVSLAVDELVVEIIRHILDHRLFVEQLTTNSTYFKDPRLIDIFNYIKEYLGGDLSNKVLATVAGVSEDYVGQYFKMLTGINPQDYIEYQRMEEAVNLLRTTKKSIRDIGREVGYKDTAYFCRRFKMMFGIPAGKMRRRESLMNV
jgi:AraC-like DNA-binding protein